MTTRRRRHAASVSHERWLVSYADFVTLLFAFFVVLFASAQVDRQRALQLSSAIRDGFQQLGLLEGDVRDRRNNRGAQTSLGSPAPQQVAAVASPASDPAEFAQVQHELQAALAAQIGRNEVSLHMEHDGLVVTLHEIGFFDSGSASIKPGAEAAFAKIATILRAHSCALRIEGHTDNVPIHTPLFASNWELSTARASGLVRSLADTYGITPELLSAAGYAEFRPAAANDSTKGRALNRRVDLVILRSQPGSTLNRMAVDATADSPPADLADRLPTQPAEPKRELLAHNQRP